VLHLTHDTKPRRNSGRLPYFLHRVPGKNTAKLHPKGRACVCFATPMGTF